MTKPWDAEYIISEQQTRQLIHEQFPEIDLEEVIVLGQGFEKLVHGDLHFRNLLVDENGTLSGVIDWGDTHIGHPAVDLSILYSFLPPEGRGLFYKIYGEVDKETKELARFKAVYTSALLLLYANDGGDESVVQAAKDGLRLALEE